MMVFAILVCYNSLRCGGNKPLGIESSDIFETGTGCSSLLYSGDGGIDIYSPSSLEGLVESPEALA